MTINPAALVANILAEHNAWADESDADFAESMGYMRGAMVTLMATEQGPAAEALTEIVSTMLALIDPAAKVGELGAPRYEITSIEAEDG